MIRNKDFAFLFFRRGFIVKKKLYTKKGKFYIQKFTDINYFIFLRISLQI